MNTNNLTFQEFLRYRASDELVQQITPYLDEITELEEQAKQDEKEIDLLREQLMFAHQLIEEILHISEKETKAKDMSKAILRAYEDSYVEL